MNSRRISPTAHYTGYTWYRHGLSHPALSTLTGRAMYQAMEAGNVLARRLGRPTLPGLLLARHACIDHCLQSAIDAGQIGQVVELAAGLSPRGWRFKQQYPQLHYLETDLPDMAAHKRALLHSENLLSPGHEVCELDILKTSGEGSMASLMTQLDPARGLAFVSEGLLNYFPQDAVEALWQRMASLLKGFPHGLYLSDLHLSGENRSRAIRAFVHLLGIAVRGRVHLHYASRKEAEQALQDSGFSQAELIQPSGYSEIAQRLDPHGARVVRIIRATAQA